MLNFSLLPFNFPSINSKTKHLYPNFLSWFQILTDLTFVLKWLKSMPFNAVGQLKYYEAQGVFHPRSSKEAPQRGHHICCLWRSLNIPQDNPHLTKGHFFFLPTTQHRIQVLLLVTNSAKEIYKKNIIITSVFIFHSLINLTNTYRKLPLNSQNLMFIKYHIFTYCRYLI